jgi:hypothetical protein
MVDDSLDIGIGKTGDWRVKLIWVGSVGLVGWVLRPHRGGLGR